MHLPTSWKKFAAAAAAALIIGVGPQLGLSESQSQQIAALAIAFILGQGIADFGKSAKTIDFMRALNKKE